MINARHRKALRNFPGEQVFAGFAGALTGNAGVTLTDDMTRKSNPPITLYSALADTTRCRIIEILADGPIPVHRLADEFSISRPAISRHLRVLKEAGLVAEVKKGRENLYAFQRQKLGKAISWIAALDGADAALEPLAAAVPVVDVAVAAPESTSQPIIVAAKVTEGSKAPKPKLFSAKKPAEDAALQAAPVSQMGFDF